MPTSNASLGALNAAVTLDVAGRDSATIDLSEAFVATLVAEVSTDNGATWAGHPIRSGSAYVASVTAAGRIYLHDMPKSPGAQFRIRVSAYTSGNAAVALTQ